MHNAPKVSKPSATLRVIRDEPEWLLTANAISFRFFTAVEVQRTQELHMHSDTEVFGKLAF